MAWMLYREFNFSLPGSKLAGSLQLGRVALSSLGLHHGRLGRDHRQEHRRRLDLFPRSLQRPSQGEWSLQSCCAKGGQHSTMVCLLASGSSCHRLDSQGSPKNFRGKKLSCVAEVNRRCCLEESGQWLENVDLNPSSSGKWQVSTTIFYMLLSRLKPVVISCYGFRTWYPLPTSCLFKDVSPLGGTTKARLFMKKIARL